MAKPNLKSRMRTTKGQYDQGNFMPKNKEKYKGNYPIIYRSSWEKKFMNYCDTSDMVEAWGSENIKIPYYNPVAKSVWNYYTDFIVKIRTPEGPFTAVIEIKPSKQTKPPNYKNRKNKKTLMYEHKTWITNKSKWEAAEEYCKKRGWKFIIMTEKDLKM